MLDRNGTPAKTDETYCSGQPYDHCGADDGILRPAVLGPDYKNIAKVVLIRLGSLTHGFNQNQAVGTSRVQTKKGGKADRGELSVTGPTNPELVPPGHCMLFVLNSLGVPGIARIVKLG